MAVKNYTNNTKPYSRSLQHDHTHQTLMLISRYLEHQTKSQTGISRQSTNLLKQTPIRWSGQVAIQLSILGVQVSEYEQMPSWTNESHS